MTAAREAGGLKIPPGFIPKGDGIAMISMD
jgi:hypothetical protein